MELSAELKARLEEMFSTIVNLARPEFGRGEPFSDGSIGTVLGQAVENAYRKRFPGDSRREVIQNVIAATRRPQFTEEDLEKVRTRWSDAAQAFATKIAMAVDDLRRRVFPSAEAPRAAATLESGPVGVDGPEKNAVPRKWETAGDPRHLDHGEYSDTAEGDLAQLADFLRMEYGY